MSRPDVTLIYRIGAGQTAALIVLAAACFVPVIYFDPASEFRTVLIVIGLASLALAALTRWMYLVVDDEGVAVRYTGREIWLPWSEITALEIAEKVRGSDTVRFYRSDRTWVDVPPSLLQPSRPTGKPAARRRLEEIARQIQSRRPTG
jgi:Bacterial PH domain